MLPGRYTVSARGHLYTVVDDLTIHFVVIVAGRVTSAASGEPLDNFRVLVDREDIFAKRLADGFFCLAGRVELLFPDLATTGYSFTVQIEMPGYVSTFQVVPVPAGSLLPLPDLAFALAYLPVRLQGRVTMATDHSPVPGATLHIDEPDYVTLRTPLHFPHLSGAPVRPVTLSPTGAGRSLDQPAQAGSSRVILNNNAGLGANNLLRFGSQEQSEILVVDGPGGAAGEVILRGALYRSYPGLAPVQQVTATPGAPTLALAEPVQTGQGLLHLTGNLPAQAVEIQDADPLRREILVLDVLSGGSAGDEGFYRLEGIVGLHTFSLHAANPANTHFSDRQVTIQERQPVNLLDLRLSTP